MKEMIVLGIMSGTSIDGVDYALCGVGRERMRLLEHWHVKFPRGLQARLHAAARGQASSHETGQLHHDLGRFYAGRAVGGGRWKPRLVGLHGQTIYHHPARVGPATLQIGEPAWLAEALGARVVSNFRAGDLAAGGEGAPLATGFHVRVFGRRGEHVCVNNLGGISNVTSIDWRRGRAPRVLAFDTGPANVLLDAAMRRLTGGRLGMDRDGAWARRGKAAEGLVGRWLEHGYFRQAPPKSTGRELFGEGWLERVWPQMEARGLSGFDVLATLVEFTARSVALNYRLHLPAEPRRVILTGGGAANRSLAGAIGRELAGVAPGVELSGPELYGWPLESIEAAAFAWLAYQRMTGEAGNLPETTGARRAVLLGQITEL